MNAIAIHPALSLPRAQRDRWVARFCEDPTSDSPLRDVFPFPLLPRGESPLGWLEDQYLRVQALGRGWDPLRETVVGLIRGDAVGFGLSDRFRVLGILVDLAAFCRFDEVVPKLRHWIRDNADPDAIYRLGELALHLRQTIWAALIGFGETEGLEVELERDLADERTDSGPLCFLELSRLSVRRAITALPRTIEWPEVYWVEILRAFLDRYAEAKAMHLLVSPELHEAWVRALRDLRWHPVVSELARPRMSLLVDLLAEYGLFIQESKLVPRLSVSVPQFSLQSLDIDEGEDIRITDERLVGAYRGYLEGFEMSLSGGDLNP